MLINIHEGQMTLSQLPAEVENGEEIVMARNSVPITRLTPLREKPIRREPGVLGTHPAWQNFIYGPKVFAPMTDEELEAEGWI